MSKLAILSLVLAACTAGGMGIDQPTTPQSAPRAKVQFHTGAVDADGARALSLAAIEPSLPSVDRMAHQVRARLGDTATAELKLCVSPAGQVTKVELFQRTSFEAFDAAVVRDAQSWKFAAMPGPATVQTCDRATISYRAHR